VLRMSKDVFLELLKANNHAAHAVMREIAQRLASMT
jgi:CRP-like cAMP-binding protein